MRVPGQMTAAEEKALRDNITRLFDRLRAKGRRMTVATLVGEVRTEQFPPNPISGQPTRIIFVVDLRLREFEGQPIVRNALISNQAQALITGSNADGTPVSVEISQSGTVTVVGRAGYQADAQSFAYYSLASLNGNDMSYVFGLRLREFVNLDAALRTRINSWRVARGLAALTNSDDYFADPQLDVHGAEYYPGYIGIADGGRFSAVIPSVVCSEQRVARDWTQDADIEDWWHVLEPRAFPNQDPWHASVTRTVCEET